MDDPELTPLAAFRRVFVADDESLAAVLPELEAESVIAVDIEMGQRVIRHPGGLQEWIHILALIQLAAGDLSVLVDPLRCSVAPLSPLMHGPARKVFLGGGQDAALLAKAGIPASNIADVGEVALALYGRREDGMAALSQRIFGISLDKTVRRTDWMIRPLNPTLVAYAHRDAELTLQIYQWLQSRHGEVLRAHERVDFDAALPASAPEWLREAVGRQASDAVAVVMEAGLDPKTDSERLAADMKGPMEEAGSPRLLNRLLRVAGELGLSPLLPQILPLAHSPSSMLRASAARAIGQLADKETGEPILLELAQDPIGDVKKAAEAGLRDVRAPATEGDEEGEEVEEVPSLNDDAMAALQRLKTQLEGSEA